jgi:Helix-turn-helix domain
VETINPWNLFVGSFIPNWLLRRPEISSNGKLVYARLCQYAGKQGIAFPKLESISEETSLSNSAVDRAIKELKNAKLIYVERHGLNKPNTYFFLIHSWITENGNQEAPKSVSLDAPKSVLLDAPKSVSPHIKRIIRRESSEENQTEKDGWDTPSESVSASITDSFESFWKAYPNKTGKKAALKAFKNARIGNGKLLIILNAVDVQKGSEMWRKENGRFIPNPSTWLNQGRWDDEPSSSGGDVPSKTIDQIIAERAAKKTKEESLDEW